MITIALFPPALRGNDTPYYLGAVYIHDYQPNYRPYVAMIFVWWLQYTLIAAAVALIISPRPKKEDNESSATTSARQ